MKKKRGFDKFLEESFTRAVLRGFRLAREYPNLTEKNLMRLIK